MLLILEKESDIKTSVVTFWIVAVLLIQQMIFIILQEKAPGDTFLELTAQNVDDNEQIGNRYNLFTPE